MIGVEPRPLRRKQPTLYVDSARGNDANDGRTPTHPLRTLQAAFDALGVTRHTVTIDGTRLLGSVSFKAGDE